MIAINAAIPAIIPAVNNRLFCHPSNLMLPLIKETNPSPSILSAWPITFIVLAINKTIADPIDSIPVNNS